MKKTIFILITTLLISNISFAQKFDELYFNYKNSKSYIIYNSEIKNFNTKLNCDSNQIYFKSELELKKWISDNIKITSFNNFDEANNSLNLLKELFLKTVEENRTFFDSLNNSKDEFETLLVTEFNNSYITVTSRHCVSECINDAVECHRDAVDSYTASMGGSGATSFFNAPGAAIAAVVATIQYNIAERKCVRALNNCVSNCEKKP